MKVLFGMPELPVMPWDACARVGGYNEIRKIIQQLMIEDIEEDNEVWEDEEESEQNEPLTDITSPNALLMFNKMRKMEIVMSQMSEWLKDEREN